MRGTQNWTIEDMAESYALWWREAGHHSATADAPFDWRAAPQARARIPAESGADSGVIVAERALPPPAAALVPPLAPTPATRSAPGDLAGFRDWLASDPAQPECAWTGPLCLPPAIAQARLTILTDMPDDLFEDAARPFAPERLRFIGAMLASIGLGLDDAVFAPLAMRRPPGGLLDEPTVSALAGRMRRYFALARPRAALVLGDRSSRALGAVQSGRLSDIAIDTGAIPTAALPNPDLLMRRPAAKAASWQTLRHLRGVTAA